MKVIELFAGIGSQSAALKRLGVDHEVIGIAELDKHAILSYAQIHKDLLNNLDKVEEADAEYMADHLTDRNIGFDFKNNKPFNWHKYIDKNGAAKDDLILHYKANVITKNYGDISKIERLPRADFWTYSFPCQDLSIAGKLKGMTENTRSGLLYQVERLLEIAETHNEKPDYLMLENVKNLVGKQFRADFDKWVYRLYQLGYNTYWKVLNAKDYGIPQNRERVFAVSIKKEIDKGYNFPEGFNNGVRLKDILEDEVDEKYYIKGEKLEMLIDQLLIKTNGGAEMVTCDYRYDEGLRPRKENISPTLTTKSPDNEGLSSGPIIGLKKIGNISESNHGSGNVYNETGLSPTLMARDYKGPIKIKQATKKGFIECKPGGVADLSYPTSETRRGRVERGGDISPTLTTQPTIHRVGNEYDFRKLTEKEYWRLMGFSDEDFNKAEKICSNSQLYKQAGNSIVVDVLYYIFKNLFTDTGEVTAQQLTLF